MIDFDAWLEKQTEELQEPRPQSQPLAFLEFLTYFNINEDDLERILANVDDFEVEYVDAGIACHCGLVRAPCPYCTHPGNHEVCDWLRELVDWHEELYVQS